MDASRTFAFARSAVDPRAYLGLYSDMQLFGIADAG